MRKKILFLTKRRPQQRDLVNSPYGRFFNLPYELAKRGHDVALATLSYERDETASFRAYGIDWYSISVLPNPAAALKRLRFITKEHQPDWVVGFSDTYYGILAVNLAGTVKAKSMIDAYDNYTSYLPYAKPLHRLWYRAIKKADLITVAGPSIAELFARETGRLDSKIIPMAADQVGFYYKDRFKSRARFGLEYDKFILGYCGAISASRGIDTLFDAFSTARKSYPQLQLVLSGRLDRNIAIPKGAIYLGFVPTEELPYLVSALDIMVVTNKLSEFGKYSYPIKLYEAMTSKIRVIASATPATNWILQGNPERLVEPENADALAQKISHEIESQAETMTATPSWRELAQELDKLMDD